MDLKGDLYELLFEVINEGLVLVDSKGTIIESNRPGEKMFGYGVGELKGKGIETLVPMRAREKHARYRAGFDEKPVARSMGANLKLDGVKKDGTEFPVQVSLNPFKTSDGNTYTVALVSDVTERRENELKLQQLRESLEEKVKIRTKEVRESERLYKSISRNFPSGVISVFDSTYKYLFAEGKGLYELGIESKDLIGIDFLERIHESARGKVKQELDEVFQGVSKDFEIEVGSQTYLINAVPLSFNKDKVDKILVVEHNITKQKEVANKLEETLRKERELIEMKTQFVSMASHEFRTPLTTVNSSASLILRHLEKGNYDQIIKHVDRIKSSVHNLTSILNDFLSFQKLETGKVKTNFNEIDVPSILLETLEDVTDMLKEGQTIDYIGPETLKIDSDPLMLKNIILNLLSNAVKYSREKGKVVVKLEEAEGEIAILVKDYGLGIPISDQKNLFTRFYRAGNVSNIEGTGLGLNIVLRYLELLKGEISFESQEGEGTTFIVRLPKK